MTPRDFIDGHEPDIVPVVRVFRAGIAEANKQVHDAASCRRLLLLVAATGRGFRTRRWGLGTCRWSRSARCRRGRARRR
ncbi:hypothetical protein, partial [Bradyrhizobium sp.]|uniref:hypothetical protein n=1 Tax=Bradyrhizobium sp. TaxID=376 RepID=UPI0025B8BF41